MDYMILDSDGNALASFTDEVTARATLQAIALVEPAAANHTALLTYDEDGMPVGEALFAWDVPSPVTVLPSEFVVTMETKTILRHTQTNRYLGGLDAPRLVRDFKPAVTA